MKKVLIVGATSAIAEATARIFAKNKARIFLLARNGERLTSMAKDLKVRGADKVDLAIFDVNKIETHEEKINHCVNSLDGLDIALIAHGTLPDQKKCEKTIDDMLHALNTNAVNTIALLTHLGNFFEKQKNGSIVAISSVAGDRGRASNYVYGSAKGAVSIFMQGLRNRLNCANVHVLTVKPGFVDTPMTKDMKKGFLWAKPQTIADGIVMGIDKKKDVVYLPGFWRWIMMIIKSIPEKYFKKMSL